jgi:regulator of protease activity HflC (stomatin/prohibitin superfamily)
LGLVIPYIEQIGHKVVMMEQVLDVPTQEAITRDNASVRADGVVFFQIMDAARASYEVQNLQVALMNLVMTNIRTVMGSMDLDQLLSHRDEINIKLLRVVDAAATPWGVKVTRIEIKDIVPPADLAEAMARQMKAEREKRAAVLEAEGARQADVLRAEGRKQAQILEAEGRKEAAFRDAEARERLAVAEASATRTVSEAMQSGDPMALNFLIAEKYISALGELAAAPNQKVLLLPLDTSGLASSLAGVAEIAKAVFASDTPPRINGGTVPKTGTVPATSSARGGAVS